MPPLREYELVEVIGEAALVDLAEAFAGTRLFVPAKMSAQHAIAEAIGLPSALKLAEAFSPDVIRVPLVRELRALRHRRQGLSNAKIAVRLGITEGAVERLFKRLRDGGVSLPISNLPRPGRRKTVSYDRQTMPSGGPMNPSPEPLKSALKEAGT